MENSGSRRIVVFLADGLPVKVPRPAGTGRIGMTGFRRKGSIAIRPTGGAIRTRHNPSFPRRWESSTPEEPVRALTTVTVSGIPDCSGMTRAATVRGVMSVIWAIPRW